MSTNLPAQSLLALADEAIDALASSLQFLSEEQASAVHAYRAARAASPRTLEEVLIVQEEDAQWGRGGIDWATAAQMTHKHALTLIEARDNARRLAGEGGGK